MKTDLEIMKDARDLIADPSRWTKHAFARDAQRLPCNVRDEEAAMFCSIGALLRAADMDNDLVGRIAHLARLMSPFGLAHFNDRHTHQQVIQLFDQAIVREEAEQIDRKIKKGELS